MNGRPQSSPSGAVACAVALALLFQFMGNATHGYIATNSLFYWWTYQWVNHDSETQHAWLILALSVFIFWQNLRRGGADGPASGKAISAILGGLALHAVGYISQQSRISILGLLLCIWGVLTLGGGKRWSRAAVFPIAFMVFAIPVNALDTVGFWLQMWVVQAGERVSHLLGIGVIRNGTQLFAANGRYQYDVVAACSGIRSLVALSAISLVIGYLWLRPFLLRTLIFLCCFPLVYIGNVIRISSIIIAAQIGGQKWGNIVHDVMGFGVFIIVEGAVIFLADLIARRRPDWAVSSGGASSHVSPGSAGPAVGVVVGIVFLMTVLEATFLHYRSAHTAEERSGIILARGGMDPVELPTYLGSSWMGMRVDPDPVEREILPPDTGFSRKRYVNLDDPHQAVLLSIVLSGRDRTSIHRPELCVVGQGFTILRSFTCRIGYPGQPSSGFRATVLDVRRESSTGRGGRSEHDIIVYWFVGNGRVVPSQGLRMAYDMWNRLTSGTASRWAYVYAQTSVEDGEDAGLARIQSILDTALPSFQPATQIESVPRSDGG
jgi:exosortase